MRGRPAKLDKVEVRVFKNVSKGNKKTDEGPHAINNASTDMEPTVI